MEEMAWLAGIVDGDGCITIRSGTPLPESGKTKIYSLQLSVSMQHRNTIERIGQMTGAGSIGQRIPYEKGNPIWTWVVTDIVCADKLLKCLYPFLVCKKAQAELAIEFAKLPSVFNRKTGVPTWLLSERERLYIACKQAKNDYGQWGCQVCNPSNDDIAWASGLFDAEGSIWISKRSPHGNVVHDLNMSLSITHFATIQRFLWAIGCGTVYQGRETKDRRTVWKWRAVSNVAKLAVNKMLKFSYTKRKELETATEFLQLPKYPGVKIPESSLLERERLQQIMKMLKEERRQ